MSDLIYSILRHTFCESSPGVASRIASIRKCWAASATWIHWVVLLLVSTRPPFLNGLVSINQILHGRLWLTANRMDVLQYSLERLLVLWMVRVQSEGISYSIHSKNTNLLDNLLELRSQLSTRLFVEPWIRSNLNCQSREPMQLRRPVWCSHQRAAFRWSRIKDLQACSRSPRTTWITYNSIITMVRAISDIIYRLPETELNINLWKKDNQKPKRSFTQGRQ
jgi:hypothetical protein